MEDPYQLHSLQVSLLEIWAKETAVDLVAIEVVLQVEAALLSLWEI
jgi:hypothetical protein